MGDVGLLGAFLGGLLALLSPCSALLLPSFFAVAFASPTRVAARVGVFTLGLLAVLVPLGAGLGAAGSLLTVHRREATVVGGLVVIALGLLVALGGGVRVPGVERARAGLDLRGGGTRLAVLALGALYGLSGFCSGPLLGAVLTLSLTGGSAAYGGALMGAYALGLVVPLLLLALAWDHLDGVRSRLRARPVRLGPVRTTSTSLLTGALLVGVGALFLVSDGTTTLPGLTDAATQLAGQEWVLDHAGAVPDAVAGLLVLAGALALVAVRLLRR